MKRFITITQILIPIFAGATVFSLIMGNYETMGFWLFLLIADIVLGSIFIYIVDKRAEEQLEKEIHDAILNFRKEEKLKKESEYEMEILECEDNSEVYPFDEDELDDIINKLEKLKMHEKYLSQILIDFYLKIKKRGYEKFNDDEILRTNAFNFINMLYYDLPYLPSTIFYQRFNSVSADKIGEHYALTYYCTLDNKENSKNVQFVLVATSFDSFLIFGVEREGGSFVLSEYSQYLGYKRSFNILQLSDVKPTIKEYLDKIETRLKKSAL